MPPKRYLSVCLRKTFDLVSVYLLQNCFLEILHETGRLLTIGIGVRVEIEVRKIAPQKDLPFRGTNFNAVSQHLFRTRMSDNYFLIRHLDTR